MNKKEILIAVGAVIGVIVLVLLVRKDGQNTSTTTTTQQAQPDTSQQLTDYQTLLALNNTQQTQWDQVNAGVTAMGDFYNSQAQTLADANKQLANNAPAVCPRVCVGGVCGCAIGTQNA